MATFCKNNDSLRSHSHPQPLSLALPVALMMAHAYPNSQLPGMPNYVTKLCL